jgi:hypothetical protein
MAQPSLEGVSLKLDRAKEHLDFLEREREPMLKLQIGRMIEGPDPQSGDYLIRIDGDLPPPKWGILVAEFAHHLRSALDNLLWQLILARGGTPVEGVTQFPIYKNEADFNRKPKRRGPWPTEADRLTSGILPEDRAFIKDAQPFKLGRDAPMHPLSMLADLNNVDKHRYIHVAVMATANLHVKGARGVLRFSDGTTFVVGMEGDRVEWVPVFFGSPHFNPSEMVGDWPTRFDTRTRMPIAPLSMGPRGDDPAEIAYVPAAEGVHANVSVQPPLTLDISFSDRERPMTIFDLQDILARVNEIVDHFRPAFV